MEHSLAETAGPEFTEALPIHQKRDEIIAAVESNQVVIITAETGAGKSTQVPQYLAEHGFQKIIVTQPRILAARNLCNRVREEWALRTGRPSHQTIGYRTAHERDDHPDNAILYCTDGLQLVREITGSGTKQHQVLILDEVHEWNENMEVLIAWARKRCLADPHFRVVIMSATIELSGLATYFETEAVISVEGRSFGVSERRGSDVVSEIVDQIEHTNHSVLVFLPGKAEIEAVTEAVEETARQQDTPIIPLHSQLEAEDQQRAFDTYPHGKIILSTNIAQTSITIDDIDIVIDSGLERRAEVRDGVEGLFLAQVSQADCTQRKGRAGRTKPGQYILAPLDEMPCLPFEERPNYATPEILRKHIDRLTLRLANIGMDIEELEFYHSPRHGAIKAAKRTLITLGAITPAGSVTDIGRQMERFPVESSYARMLVAAQPYPQEIKAKLAAIISIQEVGGITKNSARYSGWKRYASQRRSDLLAAYEVYLALPDIDEANFEELGIIAKNVQKAEEVINRLYDDLGLTVNSNMPVSEDETDAILSCIIAGQIHQLWMVEPNGDVLPLANMNGQARRLSGGTVVSHARLIAATPFDLEIPTPNGELETLHLVQGVTAVDPDWLRATAPENFSIRPGNLYYDSVRGVLARSQHMTFHGHTIEVDGSPILERSTRNKRLFSDLYAEWLYAKLKRERKAVEHAAGHPISLPNYKSVEMRVRKATYGAIALSDLTDEQRAELDALGRLQTYGKSSKSSYYGERKQRDKHHGSRPHTFRRRRDA